MILLIHTIMDDASLKLYLPFANKKAGKPLWVPLTKLIKFHHQSQMMIFTKNLIVIRHNVILIPV